MARIGIDLDGVCYNFENSVRAFLVDEWGFDRAELPDPVGWAIDEQWGMTRELFRDACHEGVNAGIIFRDGHPYPGTAEGFALLREAGHTIHIVTARDYGSPGMSALNTQEWLNEYTLEYDTITYAHDKTVVATDFMIDDKIENYDDLMKADTFAVLMDQSWNKDENGRRRNRSTSLVDFAHTVNILSKSPKLTAALLEREQFVAMSSDFMAQMEVTGL